MTEQSWKPLFRTPKSTVTKILRSPAFAGSRERAASMLDDPAALLALANAVESLDHANAPLSAIADRVAAAVRFLRAVANRPADGAVVASDAPALGRRPVEPPSGKDMTSPASQAARERLIVAALDYLVTPVDLVPDFLVGGYIDDVLLLSWVFGVAATELDPFLDEGYDVD
jgi:hypothetical protein